MKSQSLLLLAVFGLVLTIQSPASAKRKNQQNRPNRQEQIAPQKGTSSQTDSDLIRAVRDKRDVNFLEAGDLTVSKLLPDDTNGLPHQRWYVTLSDGSQVFCVYNLDMGNRIPLKIGDKVALGGQFKWTSQGALMHWLHDDPRNRRPDGYVELNGSRYGL